MENPPIKSAQYEKKESPLKKIFSQRLLYENERFFVIDKDHLSVAHRNSPSHKINNIADTIKPFISDDFSPEDLRAGIVHRLDRETSGLMICAKDPQSLAELQKLFRQRLVQKKYFALVSHRLTKGTGELRNYLKRDEKIRTKRKVVEVTTIEQNETPLGHVIEEVTPTITGKLAITHYETIALFLDSTLVDVHIETGRTHQIRAQFAHIGHPVLGDRLYQPKNPAKQEDFLYLYAYSLSFPNPFDAHREFSVQGKLPPFFSEKINQEKDNFLKEKGFCGVY